MPVKVNPHNILALRQLRGHSEAEGIMSECSTSCNQSTDAMEIYELFLLHLLRIIRLQ